MIMTVLLLYVILFTFFIYPERYISRETASVSLKQKFFIQYLFDYIFLCILIFLIQFLHPFQDYFSSYEMGQSVGGAKMGGYQGKPYGITWHTCMQNLSHIWPVGRLEPTADTAMR